MSERVGSRTAVEDSRRNLCDLPVFDGEDGASHLVGLAAPPSGNRARADFTWTRSVEGGVHSRTSYGIARHALGR